MENYRARNREKYGLLYEAFFAVGALESHEAIECFLFDLCTVQELDMMLQRLQIAKCFYDGVITYKNIEEEVKASSATISRVKQSYNYGEGGYKAAFDNMTLLSDENESENDKKQSE